MTLQISLLAVLMALFFLYSVLSKPYKDKVMNISIIIDHLCLLVVMFLMLYLRNNENILEDRVMYNIGYMMIAAVIFSLGFNLVCVIV